MSLRMLRTTRDLEKETWEREAFIGLDGQGLPSYDSPTDFRANVVDYSVPGRRDGNEFVVMRDGSQQKVVKTLYIEGEEANIPDEQDRVGPASGPSYIVGKRSDYRGLRRSRTENDHTRLLVVDE